MRFHCVPCQGALIFRGCKPDPATLAPAGSARSGSGGDEWSEALREKVPFGDEGCVSVAGLPPPPCRRTRVLDITAPERKSARPRSIVLRAIPVARETATTPPCPAARASLDANKRRSLSPRTGSSASKRALMAAMSITPSEYDLLRPKHASSRIPSLRSYRSPDSFLPIRLSGLRPLARRCA
jgi:hypothetical protein